MWANDSDQSVTQPLQSPTRLATRCKLSNMGIMGQREMSVGGKAEWSRARCTREQNTATSRLLESMHTTYTVKSVDFAPCFCLPFAADKLLDLLHAEGGSTGHETDSEPYLGHYDLEKGV